MVTLPEHTVSNANDSAGIRFTDLFNLDEIQRLQDLFSDATGVASIITHPDGTPITKPSNFCRLCKDIIRNTELGRLNCYQSDAILGRLSSSGPVVQPCLSSGLWDAGASITVNGKHIANWLIGQVRNEELDESRLLLKETQKIAQLGTDVLDINTGSRESSEILDKIFGIDPDYDKSVEGWAPIIHPEWQQLMNDYFIKEVLGNKSNFDKEYKIVQNKSKEVRWVHGIGELVYDETGQYQEHELLGKSISLVRSPRNPSDLVNKILPATLGGSWQGELLNQRKDGSEFPVFVSTSVIRDDNNVPVALIGVSEDITACKEAENEILKLNEELDHRVRQWSNFLL